MNRSELAVLYLLLLLLLTFLALSALLWGGTRWIQAMLYENVQPDLLWRAPAAAGALTLYVGVWALFNYFAAEPGQTDLPFDNIFNFTTEKVAERPVAEFEAVRGSSKVKYTRRDVPGSSRIEYRTADNKVWSASRETDVDAVVIKDGDHEVPFKAVIKTGPNKDKTVERYVEEGGRRYLDAESFGRVTTPRGGGAFVRVLLNVLHFVAWFVVLWLLLGFQWPHALGLAVALWLVATFVVPFILKKGVEAKAPPAKTQVTTLVPKLCLGTQVAKLRFAPPPVGGASCRSGEAELPDRRSQAELGNEEALRQAV
jgi:hypothetical protein